MSTGTLSDQASQKGRIMPRFTDPVETVPRVPRVEGQCLIANCEHPVHEGGDLCREHAEFYVVLCKGCGKRLRHDISVEREKCSKCWEKLRPQEQPKEDDMGSYSPRKAGTAKCADCDKDMVGEHTRALRCKECREKRGQKPRGKPRKKPPAKATAPRSERKPVRSELQPDPDPTPVETEKFLLARVVDLEYRMGIPNLAATVALDRVRELEIRIFGESAS